MRKTVLLALLALLVASPEAFATVNYGDFLGSSIDFLQVSEETQTAGDPEPLWDAPALVGTGDQLAFFPLAFTSACTTGAGDITSSTLTMTIQSHSTISIEEIALVETGDVILTSFPPFGDATTNASASVSGSLTVIEDTSGPITPVMIPFSGTFTPSDTYSLPGDFGANNWAGSFTIDVATPVPGATKAILSLDNTLDSNCGAVGNTSGKIQKKTVSGPSVAIMVNPIECALQLDKTCCVPQPPLPAGSICDGKAVRAVFEIVGGDCSDTTNFQEGEAKCSGPNPILDPLTDTVSIAFRKDGDKMDATPSTGLAVGDTFEITSSSGPILKNQLKLLVSGPGGTQQQEVHVSCSRALRCGDQFGSLRLVELESELAGTVVCTDPGAPQGETRCVPPSAPPGTQCDSKLVEAVFEFNPTNCQNPLPNPQGGSASCSGDASDANLPVAVTYVGKQPDRISVEPASGIEPGDQVRVAATGRKDFHPNVNLLISDDDSVEQSLSIHTSCSQPLGCGDVFGSMTLVSFRTKDGLEVECDATPPASPFADACEVPLTPPTPHCTSQLNELVLAYLGDQFGSTTCDVTNPQGGSAGCIGDNLVSGDVSIAIKDPTEVSADPDAGISAPGLFSITKEVGGVPTHLSSSTEFTATDFDGNSQDIVIHTSCSQPLNLGDRFGDFAVFSMDREGDGIVALGGEIEYQYTVTNPNPDPAINVSVDDSPHGPIVSGETIAGNDTETYFITKTLFESVTNVATVTGEVGDVMCIPAVDQVDVTVSLPPQGFFDCSAAKPIDGITVEWAGAQAICVEAWDGAVGGTLLMQQDSVAIGQMLTVDGMGGSPNDQVWEIFPAGECGNAATKLGESDFHISCSDPSMNGVEDCGRNQGDGMNDDPSLINDWVLEGIVGGNGSLDCTPTVIPPGGGGGGGCGLSVELLALLPGLAWLYRRRQRRAVA